MSGGEVSGGEVSGGDGPAAAGSTVIGVDVGGTFTDLIQVTDTAAGRDIRIAKVPTTADNQADGVMRAIGETGVSLAGVRTLVHGTTTTTNAMLERKTARVGLITTAGFRDVLELGRRTRPQPYGMTGSFEPLIPRELRLEVPERLAADGAVLVPLDEAAVATAAGQLLALDCEAVVIHFLHAYANPAHEVRAGEIVRGLWPNGHVTLGHALLSEYREYERGTTASVNAAVQPVLDRYLRRLTGALAAAGYGRELLVMQGNGGTLPAGMIAAEAIKTVMSGPASGVIAAAVTAGHAGCTSVISYDMGGTSSDVALIRGGVPEVSSDLELAYGLPIHVPMVDVHTIGAGGGSIARVDEAGMLQVGPDSAGATPGPVCYGRGGTRPTITDANLVLGRLPADSLLAVEQPVTVADVAARIATAIGAPLGLDATAAAAAILRIANDRMAGAIRLVSLTRGHDPRDFALFAFGGAGPLHAVALARELGIPTVLVPPRPGITNAIGCVVADARHDYVRTVNRPLAEVDMAAMTAILRDQVAAGRAALAAGAVPVDGMTVLHSADMHYRGQTHLLRVPLDIAAAGGPADGVDLDRAAVLAAFERAYDDRFAVRLPDIGAILTNLNSSVIGRRAGVPADWLAAPAGRAADLDGARLGVRPVWFDGGFRDTPVFDRTRLPLGVAFDGPAIVQQLDATTVVDPGNGVTVDRHGNLRITVASAW